MASIEKKVILLKTGFNIPEVISINLSDVEKILECEDAANHIFLLGACPDYKLGIYYKNSIDFTKFSHIDPIDISYILNENANDMHHRLCDKEKYLRCQKKCKLMFEYIQGNAIIYDTDKDLDIYDWLRIREIEKMRSSKMRSEDFQEKEKQKQKRKN